MRAACCVQLEVVAEEQRCTELQLQACKRELADSSVTHLQLNAQLEGVRGKLAAALKDLDHQRELTRDAGAKMAAMDAANDQLQEEAATKEKQVSPAQTGAGCTVKNFDANLRQVCR